MVCREVLMKRCTLEKSLYMSLSGGVGESMRANDEVRNQMILGQAVDLSCSARPRRSRHIGGETR